MNGIICINKPSDWTSFDVVAKSRGICKTKKVGHAGTLDPMATGVLPLFFGNATKVCDIMPNDDKGYVAEFRFGVTTDTLDITGTVQTQQESHVTRQQLEAKIPQFVGEIEQVPPMYSAVRVNGRRLYDIARTGAEVERKARKITVHKFQLLDFDETTQTATAEIICSKGTYIRSLCSDLGGVLGVGAVLVNLQRHIAGNFTLKDCLTLEQLQQSAEQGKLQEHLLPVEKVFDQLPKIRLNEIQSSKFLNGIRLDLNRVIYQQETGYHTVFHADGRFMGLASLNLENMQLVIEKMFMQR